MTEEALINLSLIQRQAAARLSYRLARSQWYTFWLDAKRRWCGIDADQAEFLEELRLDAIEKRKKI